MKIEFGEGVKPPVGEKLKRSEKFVPFKDLGFAAIDPAGSDLCTENSPDRVPYFDTSMTFYAIAQQTQPGGFFELEIHPAGCKFPTPCWNSGANID